MIYCIDTHALIWYLSADSRLGKRALEILDGTEHRFMIPAIAVFEVRYHVARRHIPEDLLAIVARFYSRTNCIVWPIDSTVVRLAPLDLDIHDAIICGSALAFQEQENEEVALITKDRQIREWGGLPIIW